jgi:hypothetical protein
MRGGKRELGGFGLRLEIRGSILTVGRCLIQEW